MGDLLGHVVSVNVGRPRTVEWHGRPRTSAIWKSPVDGPVEVDASRPGITGDEQADLRVHGGLHKAVYAYSQEDYAWWAGEMPDTSFTPGLFGENLTTAGVDLAEAVIGERWSIGTAVLEVSQPRFPCANLGMRMGDAAFVDRFDAARRSGAYFRIVEPGHLSPGDDIIRLTTPTHGLRITDLVAAKHDAPTPLLHRIRSLTPLPDDIDRLTARRLTLLEPR